MSNGIIAFIVLVVIIAITITIIQYIYDVRDYFRMRPFVACISEYTNIAGLKTLDQDPYVIGKALIIDKTKNEILDPEKPYFFNLPKELQPARPEEVGTIVWLEWGKVAVAKYKYEDASRESTLYDYDANIQTCKVTIIDKNIPAIIGQSNFRGMDPPKSLRVGVNETAYIKNGQLRWYGDRPEEEIVNYLKKLPRR